MLQYLFDTDHLTLYDHADAAVWRHFSAHPLGSVGISAPTVEEKLRGRLAVLARHRTTGSQVQAYARLIASLELFQQFPIVAFDQACEAEYLQLRRLRLRIGSQDLRIAATALTNSLTLVRISSAIASPSQTDQSSMSKLGTREKSRRLRVTVPRPAPESRRTRAATSPTLDRRRSIERRGR